MFGASVASRTFQLETDEGVEVQSSFDEYLFSAKCFNHQLLLVLQKEEIVF